MSKLTDYDYLPIIRNRDENGIILTYSVEASFKIDGKPYYHEFNTLKEARISAIIND